MVDYSHLPPSSQWSTIERVNAVFESCSPPCLQFMAAFDGLSSGRHLFSKSQSPGSHNVSQLLQL